MGFYTCSSAKTRGSIGLPAKLCGAEHSQPLASTSLHASSAQCLCKRLSQATNASSPSPRISQFCEYLSAVDLASSFYKSKQSISTFAMRYERFESPLRQTVSQAACGDHSMAHSRQVSARHHSVYSTLSLGSVSCCEVRMQVIGYIGRSLSRSRCRRPRR